MSSLNEDKWVTPYQCIKVLQEVFKKPYQVRKIWVQPNKAYYIFVINEKGVGVSRMRVYNGTEHANARVNMVLKGSLDRLRKLGQ